MDRCKLQNGSQSFREHLTTLQFQGASVSRRNCVWIGVLCITLISHRAARAPWSPGLARRGWLRASSLELGSKRKHYGCQLAGVAFNPSLLSGSFLMFVGFSLKIDLALWIFNVLLLGKSMPAWQCHIHKM